MMFNLTVIGYIISYALGIVIFLFAKYNLKIKHEVAKIYIVLLLMILGFFFFYPLVRSVSNRYSKYSIIIIIIFIFSLLVSDISYIHKCCGDSVSLIDSKFLEINDDLNFLKSLSMTYIICLLLLPVCGISYLYMSSPSNVMEDFESISVLALSLVISIIIYVISDVIVIKTFVSNYNINVFEIIYHICKKKIKHVNRKRIILIDLLLFMSIVTVSFFILYHNSLSYTLSNHIYSAVIQSKYYNKNYLSKMFLTNENNYKSLNKHEHRIYSYKISNDNIIFNLNNRPLKNKLGVQKDLKFHLYKFTNKKYYFEYNNYRNDEPLSIKVTLKRCS